MDAEGIKCPPMRFAPADEREYPQMDRECPQILTGTGQTWEWVR